MTSSSSQAIVDLSTSPSTSSTLNATRISKRKLDDAIQSLDDAVGPSETSEPPAKRANKGSGKSPPIRSLYSTLAKYGIKSKHNDFRQNASSTKSKHDVSNTLSQSTPNLTAILSRTRKALPFKFQINSASGVSLPMNESATEYRPSSISSFLTRLATFKLSTYANKPSALDPVAASKAGWVNSGKDRLKCGICAMEWVVAGREGMSRDAANAFTEKQRLGLVGNHKDGCPWKTRQCDPTIYRIPLQSAAAMTRDIKLNAIALHPVLQGVEIKHPLTSSQLSALRSTLSTIDTPTTGDPVDTESMNPSEAAILTSLFGWSLAPVAAPTPSLSRANSGSSTPRSSSVSSFMRGSTPSGINSLTTGTSTPVISHPRPLMHGLVPPPKRDTALLHCVLCQRRIGLWAFAPAVSQSGVSPSPSGTSTPITVLNVTPTTLTTSTSSSSTRTSRTQPTRQFDLLKEHRSYCPYAVRSTVVPSLTIPNSDKSSSTSRMQNGSQTQLMRSSSVSQLNGETSGALEGWRAVLTLVLRYGMGQRQRLGLVRRRTGDANARSTVEVGTEQGEEEEAVDDVEAMVAGVKRKGGRELLKYVKGLLG